MSGVGNDDRVGLRSGELGWLEGDLAERAGPWVGDVPRQVPEPVVGRVEDAVAVGLRVDGGRRVGRAVDDRRVVERLHADRDVRCRRDQRRLAERLHVRVTGRVVVRVGDRRVLGVLRRRPEPRAVHPASEGAHARRVARVLRRHVDVRCPQAALAAPLGVVPGRVGLGHLRRARHERLVLDDERGADAEALEGAAGADQALLHGVGDQVAGCLAGVHVQPGDAPRMVVVEHQPGALLVGVEERLAPGAGIRHVGHVADADALADSRWPRRPGWSTGAACRR